MIISGGSNINMSNKSYFLGIIGGFVLEAAVRLLSHFKIDDPIQAFPVHGACGLWGVIAIGIFDMDKGHW
jgi:ammonium transporter, Amt family